MQSNGKIIEAKFTVLLNLIADPIVSVDERGKILAMNEGLKKLACMHDIALLFRHDWFYFCRFSFL